MRHDSYYEQPDVPEFEKELSETVSCHNEDCSQFEVELEQDLLFYFTGNYGSATYTCPTCNQDSEIEIERDSSDWYDSDADYDSWKDSQW